MTTRIFDLDKITGNEALTVGERISSLYKEFSLGIDKFNAKHFNKYVDMSHCCCRIATP